MNIFLIGNSLLSGTAGIDQYIQTIFSKMMVPEAGETPDSQSTPVLRAPFDAYLRKAYVQSEACFGKTKNQDEKKIQV